MYHAVQGFLTEFLSSTTAASQFPALAEDLATLITLIQKIENFAYAQEASVKARIRERDAAQQEAITLALDIAGTLLSYARKQGLPGLELETDLYPTSFTGRRLADRMRLVQRIYDLARPLQRQLTELGLTGTQIADLPARIATAATASEDRARAQEHRKVATQQLAAVFKAADALLDAIDPMLRRVAQTDRETYDRYLAARTVFDLPGVRNKAEGATAGAVAASPATAVSPARDSAAAARSAA